MPPSEIESALQAMPEFAAFRQIVTENIRCFPSATFDPFSVTGHRVRVFSDPPRTEVRYSERALARSIELTDMLFAAKSRDSAEVLAAGLMVLCGSDLLRRDKFGGLGLLARGFMIIGFEKLPFRQIIGRALELSEPDQGASRAFKLANLFLPLAHEIGHLAEAQAIAPKAFRSDAIYETYRINYERVIGFTREFDYAPSLNDRQSPLCLSTLREEAASDFFAVCAVCSLTARTASVGQEFPLTELTLAILSFPVVMVCQSLCLQGPRLPREVQEITLAMHCRYSLIIDSLRSALKMIFKNHSAKEEAHRTIDACVDGMHDQFAHFYQMVWKAIVQFVAELNKVASLGQSEILKIVGEATKEIRTQLAIAKYLDVIASEVEGYPLSGENLTELRVYGQMLRTFDKVVVEEGGVRLFR